MDDDTLNVFYHFPFDNKTQVAALWMISWTHQSIDDVMMMDTHFSIHVLQQKR